jgi:hypothetical protein
VQAWASSAINSIATRKSVARRFWLAEISFFIIIFFLLLPFPTIFDPPS